MSLAMDFGWVALAGGFLRPERFENEQKYPLRLFFCGDCYAVQVVDKVSADVLFQDYFYFSSSIGTLREHFRKYAAEVTSRFLNPPSAAVLEFGCNDGVLLQPLADEGIGTVIGVDPASNVLSSIDDQRLTLINDFFNESVADSVIERYGRMDMVLANNVYAHIPDIQSATQAVAQVLKRDGVFIFEVHYLGRVIDEMQYDMIYHEHLYYYSLLSAISHFAQYGMVVFDVQPVSIHAGSLRFYVCKSGSKHEAEISTRVSELKKKELERGFNNFETFQQFSNQVAEHKEELLLLLNRLRGEGYTIAGYGASGRANTIIQYCGLDHRHLDFMIDDAPAKQGVFTPGSHFRIHPSTILEGSSPPDFLLVFAWSFLDEIQQRNQKYLDNGGRMIIPLPEIRTVPPGC